MESQMVIQKAGPPEFSRIVDLISNLCKDPVSQCLHSTAGENPPSLLREIEKWHETGEIYFITAYHEGELIGTMGCEFDSTKGRGWLRGPFAIRNWEATASALYHKLIETLPKSIQRLDTFLHIKNTLGNAFYRDNGFEYKETGHTYIAKRPESLPVLASDCIPLPSPNFTIFSILHKEIFPETYYTGHQIIEQIDDNHKVFIFPQESGILGYIYITAEPWADEGYVEYLGVHKKSRGQGIGGKLLAAGLHWAFSEKHMPQVGLTVTDANTNARSLYERSGFNLDYTGINYRLLLPPNNG